MPYTIDERLKDFLESGVATSVGTGSRAGMPHVVWGWGTRVSPEVSLVDVFLDAPRAAQSLENLRSNGRIAITSVDPPSARSVQLKGQFIDSGEPDADDLAWVARHRQAFLTATLLIGDPPDLIRNLWMDEVVRVSFTVERAFNQTPGPDAGKPL